MLAAEPVNDLTDPWPDIRRRVSLAHRSPHLRVLKSGVRAWAAGVAAVLVVGLGVGGAVFANQAQTASAAETLYQLQVEAATSSPGPGPCAPAAPAKLPSGVGTIAFGSGSGAAGPGTSAAGPETISVGGPETISSSDASQLSDKLAQALGVSGDRVREAIRQTLAPELPSGPPPDPLAAIARQLGVSTEQVCAAFSKPNAAGVGVMVSGSVAEGKHVTTGGPGSPSVVFNINGTAINLDTETADQLSEPAQKLGVSPERLLAAIKASTPAPPPLPPTPPNPDDIINRLAKNLGMSPDKVRAAITQVEGPNRFFFVVPLPDFGH